MKNYVLLGAIVLAGIVPFSSRAVYLDEPIFLQMARAAQTNWLFPQDSPGIFFGTPVPNFAAHTHPPVGEYYLSALYSVFGKFREVPFRLSFSVFAIAAVLGLYSLARRFTSHPFLVSLLFAASPAFFLYSASMMMDIPMLAFLLVGFALYFGHVDGRRWLLPPAALCFTLALGTGYIALVPLTCFLVALIAARRPLGELMTVCAAPAALALWLLAITIHFGEFPLIRTIGYYAAHGSVAHNILATCSFLGGVTVFPGLIGGRRRTIVASVLIAAGLCLFVSSPSLAYRAWYVVLASSGLLTAAAFLGCARRLIAEEKNRGESLLLLWAPAVLLCFITVGEMINARYILVAIPPLYVVLFANASRRRLIYTLVPTAALSLTLAYADFVLVNANRDLVERSIVPLQQQGFRVWSGAESGLRFYLERRGMVSLSFQDVSPGPGDLIVRHDGHFRYSLAERVATMLFVLKTFTLNTSFPVRTYSVAAGAGFHDSGAGLVPFTFSREPLDSVQVAQVSPLAPAAVWSPEGPVYVQNESQREFPMKFPSDTEIAYEVDGAGVVSMTADRIRLVKGRSPTLWKNFRIVPKQFTIP
jgi:hypothetical protein